MLFDVVVVVGVIVVIVVEGGILLLLVLVIGFDTVAVVVGLDDVVALVDDVVGDKVVGGDVVVAVDVDVDVRLFVVPLSFGNVVDEFVVVAFVVVVVVVVVDDVVGLISEDGNGGDAMSRSRFVDASVWDVSLFCNDDNL